MRIPIERQGQTGMGQGGYGCWFLANHIGRPVTTALRSPLPLDTDLVVEQPEADRWVLVDPANPNQVILEARPWEPDCPDTEAVSLDQASAARNRFLAGGAEHPAPHCISCGTGPDSLHVHAGQLADGRFATPFRLPERTAIDGAADASLVWMAVDCACGWYTSQSGDEPSRGVTVQFAVDATAPVELERDYVLVAWNGDSIPGWDGRKRGAAAALFTTEGECIVRSRSLWVRPA